MSLLVKHLNNRFSFNYYLIYYNYTYFVGVNPVNERGSRTGVFSGVCTSEAHEMWSQQPNRVEGTSMTGCAHAMFANRISYGFNFNGPSCCFDTACSTSFVALEAAVSAIRARKCDAAVVTASNLILKPQTTMEFNKLSMLAPDSKCKSFSNAGDGYVRSEAIVTIYIQKKSDAKRIYATILHIKTNTDGFKDNGISFPSAAMQEKLMESVYSEAGVTPNQVSYFEAHATGTKAGDSQEIMAMTKVYCRSGRDSSNPLLIGSHKSNMGHSEAASGLCALSKIVIMLQEGVIPANLHFIEPMDNMRAIKNGVFKVIALKLFWYIAGISILK